MTEHYHENPSMFKNNPFGFIGAILLIPIGVGIGILLYWYIKTRSEKLIITDDEVIYERGILNKHCSEIDIECVRSVRVEQNFIARIMGTGRVELYTSGDDPEIVAPSMPDPDRIRKLIKSGKGY